MTLDAWLAAEGDGAPHRLMFAAGVSYPVIARARKGRANLASATKIHLATGRKVPIESMTRDDVTVARRVRKHKRAR